jgi:hypothetical protein
MKLERLMASAVGAAAMIVIATAPAALAKSKGGKPPTSFSVGCLTQDTALQTSEGLSAGAAAATVTISPASLWPPNHKLESEDISMTLPADAASAVDVSLQVTDITDDQLAADNGKGDGCGQPTSKQGADWVPTTFPGVAATGTLELTTDSLALDGVEVRSERCAKLGTRTYTITVQCCDTTNSVCDTAGTVNGITLDSLPALDVTIAKSQKH